MFKHKVQNGAIPFSHESVIDLFHQLEARFNKHPPSFNTVRCWPGWKLQLAHLWLRKQTSLDRPDFLRRYS